ncbi:hypothetical protein EMPS_05583 [Entomortierella parvispora]|uniref:Arm-like repeat domain-containing protein n=1 Tax=Entomortierella parvispora TaxID=205924 RepID=A0A9P3LWW7_9FUNG|nr:hypothetical protein EMPS_05583 [Entomortierella parvispora]
MSMANSDSFRLSIRSRKPGLSISNSNSSVKPKKSSRLSNWFHGKNDRAKDKVDNEAQRSQTNSPTTADPLDRNVSSLSIAEIPNKLKSAPTIQPVPSIDIFLKNMTRTLDLDLPTIGQRIESIAQLVHCGRLLQSLESNHLLSSPMLTTIQGDATGLTFNRRDIEWLTATENKPMEKDRIRQLLVGIVSEFISDPIKDSEAIREIVLVGPVLERVHFRSLLTCFVTDFAKSPLMVVEKLQGLTQLVQEAPSGSMEADDLINILDAIAKRLQGTSSQSHDYVFHLTVAISKVLGVMADQNVEGLDRVLQHDPLGKALSALKKHNNPFLRYQAIYGYQALQWVPNNESQLQRSLRLGSLEQMCLLPCRIHYP